MQKDWEQAITKVKQRTDPDDVGASFLLLFTNWTDMGGSTNSTMVCCLRDQRAWGIFTQS